MTIKSRMKAYNAFVLPVLLFNASAWGVCESVIKKIKVFYRKQLRHVLGVRWPYKISNKALYEKCGAKPLGLAMRRFRWNLFGHVLVYLWIRLRRWRWITIAIRRKS